MADMANLFAQFVQSLTPAQVADLAGQQAATHVAAAITTPEIAPTAPAPGEERSTYLWAMNAPAAEVRAAARRYGVKVNGHGALGTADRQSVARAMAGQERVTVVDNTVPQTAPVIESAPVIEPTPTHPAPGTAPGYWESSPTAPPASWVAPAPQSAPAPQGPQSQDVGIYWPPSGENQFARITPLTVHVRESDRHAKAGQIVNVRKADGSDNAVRLVSDAIMIPSSGGTGKPRYLAWGHYAR